MHIGIQRQILIAACTYLGGMQVGYSMGWTAPVIPKLQNIDETPLDDVLSEETASWVGSILYIGSIIGPHVTADLSNRIGRKPCLIIGGVLTLISYIMVIFTKNLATLLAMRVVNGLGIGTISVGVSVYVGEIASTHIRGILLTCNSILASLGTLICYTAGPYVSFVATGYIGIGLSALFIIGISFIPESPIFMILKGKEDKAKEILQILGRENELKDVLQTKDNLNQNGSKLEWFEIFTVKSNRKALFITLTLLIFQQASGIVVVTFFTTTIFELAGSSITPFIATIIIGVTQLLSSAVVPLFVDLIGRRTLLLISTAVCAISLATLGTYFYLDHIDHSLVDSIGWIPLATLVIYFISYDMGFGVIPVTLVAEMFNINVRSSGSALTITSAWLVGFGISTAFGYMITALGGHFTFWFFSASCLLAFVFSLFFVPETKGKSLAEIQALLSR